MNKDGIGKLYGRLTPEERFKLVLAAGDRGDWDEQRRLTGAGERIALSLQDHAPYANAFDELALVAFMELVEKAADYREALDRALAAQPFSTGADAAQAVNAEANKVDAQREADEKSVAARLLDVALLEGYALKTRCAGWTAFCEKMDLPPFAIWQTLPGFARLQRALQLAEQVSFEPDEVVRWLNRVRPAGQPEEADVGLTPQAVAAGLDKLYRQFVAWWVGE